MDDIGSTLFSHKELTSHVSIVYESVLKKQQSEIDLLEAKQKNIFADARCENH